MRVTDCICLILFLYLSLSRSVSLSFNLYIFVYYWLKLLLLWIIMSKTIQTMQMQLIVAFNVPFNKLHQDENFANQKKNNQPYLKPRFVLPHLHWLSFSLPLSRSIAALQMNKSCMLRALCICCSLKVLIHTVTLVTLK